MYNKQVGLCLQCNNYMYQSDKMILVPTCYGQQNKNPEHIHGRGLFVSFSATKCVNNVNVIMRYPRNISQHIQEHYTELPLCMRILDRLSAMSCGYSINESLSTIGSDPITIERRARKVKHLNSSVLDHFHQEC